MFLMYHYKYKMNTTNAPGTSSMDRKTFGIGDGKDKRARGESSDPNEPEAVSASGWTPNSV